MINNPCEESVREVQWNAAVTAEVTETRRGMWAVVLGARIFPDGNQWCVLYGNDLMTGICAFGDTPEKAIEDFEMAMRAPIRVPTGDTEP